MKVLASYPDGRASVAAMKSDLAILAGAGADWSRRLRSIADRAPNLDIFSGGYVVRDERGWQLTETGRKMLGTLEASARASAFELSVVEEAPGALSPPLLATPMVTHIRAQRRRRLAAYGRSA